MITGDALDAVARHLEESPMRVARYTGAAARFDDIYDDPMIVGPLTGGRNPRPANYRPGPIEVQRLPVECVLSDQAALETAGLALPEVPLPAAGDEVRRASLRRWQYRHRWAVCCHGCGYGTTMETRAVARRWAAGHVLSATRLAVGAVVHRTEVLRVEYRPERDRKAERQRLKARRAGPSLLDLALLLPVMGTPDPFDLIDGGPAVTDDAERMARQG